MVKNNTVDAERVFAMCELSEKFYKVQENALKMQDTLVSLIEPGVERQILYLKAKEMADGF